MLVAGVGNRLMGDDGFGPRVIDILSSFSLPEWVEIRDIGTAGPSLASDLDEYTIAIFLDATETGLGPGVVSRVELETRDLEAEDLQGINRISFHEGGLADLIALSKALGSLPEKLYLIGCEPADLRIPFCLSSEMEHAAHDAARDVLSLLESLSGVGCG